MTLLRNSLILIILSSTYGYADCVKDCRNVIAKCDVEISDLKAEIVVRNALEKALADQNIKLTLDINEKTQTLSSWVHNPFLVAGISILIGGLTTEILVRH